MPKDNEIVTIRQSEDTIVRFWEESEGLFVTQQIALGTDECRTDTVVLTAADIAEIARHVDLSTYPMAARAKEHYTLTATQEEKP